MKAASIIKISTLALLPLFMSACASTDFKYAQGPTEVGEQAVFAKQYQRVDVSQADVQLIKSIEQPIHIVALFGEWCHDSKREIPYLKRLVDEANNSNVTLELIGISTDKQQPAADIAKYGLRYTPTMVVLKEGQEIGRIIERPKTTLAGDIIAMLEG